MSPVIFSPHQNFRVIKSQIPGWAEPVTSTWVDRNAYKILVGT